MNKEFEHFFKNNLLLILELFVFFQVLTDLAMKQQDIDNCP